MFIFMDGKVLGIVVHFKKNFYAEFVQSSIYRPSVVGVTDVDTATRQSLT